MSTKVWATIICPVNATGSPSTPHMSPLVNDSATRSTLASARETAGRHAAPATTAKSTIQCRIRIGLLRSRRARAARLGLDDNAAVEHLPGPPSSRRTPNSPRRSGIVCPPGLDRCPRGHEGRSMDDLQRARAVLYAVEETRDRLRDRDDPTLEEYIGVLEQMHADIEADIATREQMYAH